MVRFYLGKLRGLVGVFGLPDLVEETASTYLKRFFVKRCALEWSVKDIMLTCLYLSLKSTSHTVPLSYFATKIAGKAPGKDAVKEMEQTIRGLEFGVADAIGWELSVHGPGRALRGLVYDMQSLQPSPLSALHALLPRAQSLLWSARLTDLELLYPPSQIALACLLGSASSSSSADAQAEQQDEAAKLVNCWLQNKYERGEREHQRRREEYQKIQAKASSNKEGSKSALANTETSGASNSPKAPFDQTIEDLQSSLRKILGVIVAQEALSKEMSKPASAEKDEAGNGGKAPSRELVEVKRIDALLKASADPAKRPGSASHMQTRRAQDASDATKRSHKASKSRPAALSNDPFDSPDERRNVKRNKLEAPPAGLGNPFDGQPSQPDGRSARVKGASEWDSDDDVPTSKDALKK
ncbi:Cdk activating kinase (CAK)/RNA polymerase II transcription initiation/nucleotide excision repair factor TFIIH/TFIIK, cyclin H subunit [Ceraceosorus bombacis]|uniref:Cdk activating kinase (CAK)/RNA polymerase II transcription initiation/nucleotide excision repair factor TFIIH/TFIIK, cyclin H subunit n=1 Tax=Ceraceosorus bombacis TaxID=401625 RepID=A0A0N7L9J1_9BASI|nr:Cdk activating kinase (CAK)/RNA polymerase II transcription initiation/nucleotide excision repair factor TFIIH/TFIIK, cyclin H subunit [Ceraceosorus bombacis]